MKMPTLTGINMSTIPNTTTASHTAYLPQRDKGYVNINSGLAAFGVGINGGFKIGKDGVYPYLGICLVAPGPSLSLTSSTSTPSPGWSMDFSGFFPKGIGKYLGGSLSSDASIEGGLGTAGLSACANYTR